MMTFETWFPTVHPEIPLRSAEAVMKLTTDGATVPFIARYRKEQTGSLDEVGIANVIEASEKWESILRRQKHIVEEIDRQKKLTPELKERVLSTFKLEVLDDIYLPYKLKRKTKAQAAREAGLEPLADWIWNTGHGTEEPQPGQTLEIWAFTFRNDEKDIKDAAAAIAGAQDILIERLSETEELRTLVRSTLFEQGGLKTGKGPKPKPHSKYENYFDYFEPIQSLLEPQNSHRYLAIRRGWMEEELSLAIGGKPVDEAPAPASDDKAEGEKPAAEAAPSKRRKKGGGRSEYSDPFEVIFTSAFESAACSKADAPGADVLKKAARLALRAHVQPSIEGEVHKALKDIADSVAIRVFSENVKKLLLASPFGPKAVLGVDPGLRTGCKLALIDDSGKYLVSTVMHLQTDDAKEAARKMILEVVPKIRAIAVGNGTAGRETESFLRKTLKDAGIPSSQVAVVMVNESGASVYSASDVAREEFPDLDVTVRGAISIARRLQDPLAELVKVDPKSIGVGQYQHDVSEHSLKKSLELVVDSCVNQVGVNLNTASYHLLSRVSGIGPALAKSIVDHRGSKGIFKSREDLKEVPRFSTKAFEQAAGFLRVPESENPLENTGVHPERYPILEGFATKLGKSVRELMGKGVDALKKAKELRDELGSFTFDDIIKELEKPGRDPREEFELFQYREDIHELKDLQPGMVCPGIVTNVTNFGAFVDIGVHQDGLVHLSQLANRYVKDPREVVSPGDKVEVRVLEVSIEKSQISLSMKAPQERRPPRERPARENHERERRPQQRPQQQAKPSGPPPVAPLMPGQKVPQPSGPRPKPPRPKEVFNNAFAGLASLKGQLKK